jgi:hypothetical protein
MTSQVIEVYGHVLPTLGCLFELVVNVSLLRTGGFLANSCHSFYMPVYAGSATFPNLSRH